MTESETAAALLDAAEAAFATSGIDRASLRAIMRAAGADPGAVHYHYGSREALASAVLDRILRPINERRLELLDLVEDPTLPALIEAIVRPDLEAAERLGENRRLVGLIYAQPGLFVETLVEDHFRPVALSFMPALSAALDHLDPDEIAWRIRWCVFGLLGAVLSAERSPIDLDALDLEVERIVIVAAGALAAQRGEKT